MSQPESPQPKNGQTKSAQPYGRDPVHHYPLLAPRFWHGLRMGDWWRLAKKNRFRFAPTQYGTATTITSFAAFNSTFAALQRLTHGRRIGLMRPKLSPLFVLGHWRSGTTMLHEMLIRDPRNSYPNTYDCFAPHHCLVTHMWIRPMIGWMLPKKRPMDNVAAGWSCPQEDEFALCSLGVPSPYLCWAFPKHGPVNREYLTLDQLTSEQREAWKQALQTFVATISVKDDRRLVMKSPPHTARVRTLLEAFPSAKFLHIVRDPLTLYPSTMRLWKSLSDAQSLQGFQAEYDWIEPYVLDNLVEMYEAFERDRPLIAPGHLAEVRYEELVADPVGELRRVYDELDLGGFDQIEPHLTDYLGDNRDYKTNRYDLGPDVEARVRERWAPYFKRYGYEGQAAPQKAAPTSA